MNATHARGGRGIGRQNTAALTAPTALAALAAPTAMAPSQEVQI